MTTFILIRNIFVVAKGKYFRLRRCCERESAIYAAWFQVLQSINFAFQRMFLQLI